MGDQHLFLAQGKMEGLLPPLPRMNSLSSSAISKISIDSGILNPSLHNQCPTQSQIQSQVATGQSLSQTHIPLSSSQLMQSLPPTSLHIKTENINGAEALG